MESSEHNWANISETICPTMLVFGKKASRMFFFQNILTNPIISQIQFFYDVTLWYSIEYQSSTSVFTVK